MRAIVSGTLRFDRRSIPAELSDIGQWPTADDSGLDADARSLLARRIQAMTLFVDGSTSLRAIGRETGLRINDLYRLFERCITRHEDGRIYGCRALLPWLHTQPYERSATVKASGAGGASGAFAQLLQRYPDIAQWIERKVAARSRPHATLEEVPRQIWRLHAGFLAQCRQAGIPAHEYPFNQKHLGERSLARHVKRLAGRRFAAAARAAGAQQIDHAWQADLANVRKPATYPYEVVEFDGHKLDVRLTLRIDDPFGFETLLVLHRIWILLLLDVASRAVIGYAISPGREYNRDDVAQALRSALMPHRSRETMIPALRVRQGGGFPSEVIPETAWACWSTLRFDAARAHFANATLERLTTIVGCATDNGPLGEKNERAFVERFFDQLASHFAHRLPATTGRDPPSVERALSEVGGDTSLMMTLDELEDVIDVVLANYNGEPHTGLGGRTPLEAMHFRLAQREGLLRTLPEARRSALCLLQEARIVTIRGNVARGVRPHVNFEYVRYDNGLLSGMTGLIGQQLRVYFNVKDLRHLHAFFMNGAELGVLTAARPWCFTPHSLRIRQEIFSLIRQRKLAWREGEDPVGAWFAWKKEQARQHARDANDLARMLTDRAKAHTTAQGTAGAMEAPPSAPNVVRLPTPVPAREEPVPWLTKIITY
ncbi:putative transposase [Paraburkholderia youngii]